MRWLRDDIDYYKSFDSNLLNEFNNVYRKEIAVASSDDQTTICWINWDFQCEFENQFFKKKNDKTNEWV